MIQNDLLYSFSIDIGGHRQWIGRQQKPRFQFLKHETSRTVV